MDYSVLESDRIIFLKETRYIAGSNIDYIYFFPSFFFLSLARMKKNWRATLVQTSVSLTPITERHVSTASIPFYIYDCRASNPCFPFRLPEIDFRSRILEVTRTAKHRSRPFFLCPFEEIVCHVLEATAVLSCMPAEILRAFFPSSRTLLDNLGEIASFHSPMKIL